MYMYAVMELPEVEALKEVPAGPPEHHPEGTAFEHTRMVVERVDTLTGGNKLAIFAAALHDTGKARTDRSKWPLHHGHHELSEQIAQVACERAQLEEDDTMFVLLVAHYHHSMHRASEMSDKAWRRIFRPLKWNRERVELFIACCQADHEGRGGEIKPYPEADLARRKFEELKDKG